MAQFGVSETPAVMRRFWADCAQAGGALAIARPSREARNFLRLGELDDLIEIYATVEEAAEGVMRSGPAGPRERP